MTRSFYQLDRLLSKSCLQWLLSEYRALYAAGCGTSVHSWMNSRRSRRWSSSTIEESYQQDLSRVQLMEVEVEAKAEGLQVALLLKGCTRVSFTHQMNTHLIL